MMYWKKVHKIKNPPWETISIDNYQEVVNYGLDHKKISKLKLIYAQHNNLFMAYLLVWAVSFCRRFFCPLYPRILKAFLLRMLWSWKIDELCEKGGKNVSFLSFLTAMLSANMKYVCISQDLLKCKIHRAFWYWYVFNCQNLILNSLFAWKWICLNLSNGSHFGRGQQKFEGIKKFII